LVYWGGARRRGAGQLSRVLMSTLIEGDYDEAEGLESGADDYLSIPFSFVVLVPRIRALRPSRPGGAATVLRVGQLVLDPATRLCRRGEQEVSLTAKEFAVLEHLAVRAGEVVSKADILEHVWDFAYDGDPNIVEVYISALRRKIDAPFACRTILTVRGAGYRLTADRA
ncbi:response regulator transcription factor, partial [Nocardia cyriacigeorgica]|uniref:response regulator transcription factor n=1 Tax=Nocardia cyriacigeorgica TaxID=135487 RepID=UPI002457B1F0